MKTANQYLREVNLFHQDRVPSISIQTNRSLPKTILLQDSFYYKLKQKEFIFSYFIVFLSHSNFIDNNSKYLDEHATKVIFLLRH